MTQEVEEIEVGEYHTGFAANRSVFIANNGVISGSSIVDVKVGSVGGPTERRSLSVGDSMRYDGGAKGVFEILLLSIRDNLATFLVSQVT